jgi:flagellar hook-associated protein 1 FlgK
MLGLFGTLDMGARALSVQQEQMAVTGQNLSNANNAAYSVQTLNVTASTPLETPIGDEGTGIDATSITSASDPYLNSQIQAQDSLTSSLTAQQTGLENAQAYLDEQITSTGSSATPDSPNGLASSLSTLFDSFSAMENDPSSLPLQQTAVQSAQNLSTQFQQISSQLSGVRDDLNSSIQSEVTDSNQDLATIASLNKQIVEAESSGGTANDLVDQREATLEDLSNQINITTSTESNGAVNVNIGNVAMVTGVTQTDSLGTFDASGNGQLVLQANSAPGTELTGLSGGNIYGNITARDGALADLQTGVNTLASQLITNVNSIYSQGYDANGNTGQDLFTGTDASDIGVNSSLVGDPSEFQYSSTGATGDNGTVSALAALGSQNIAGLSNQTFSGNYAQTVTDLGSAISSVNDQLDTNQSVSQMLTSQRASTAGVSLDSQMTDLIQYQKAYEASAELVTTVNEMLQTVISMKTQ